MQDTTNKSNNKIGLIRKVFDALKVTKTLLITGALNMIIPATPEIKQVSITNIIEKNSVASILPISIFDLLYGLINNNLIVPFSVSLVTSPEIIIIVKIIIKIVQIFKVE